MQAPPSTATDHQFGRRLARQRCHQGLDFIGMDVWSRQDKAELLPAGRFQDGKTLAGMAGNGHRHAGHAFLLQQLGQHLTGGSTQEAYRLTLCAQAMQHAGYIDTASTGMALHRIAAQLAGGSHTLGDGRHIQCGI